LFAATGDHLQLVVLDRANASHLVTAHDLDASIYDVTVVDDVIDDPTHGPYPYDTMSRVYLNVAQGTTGMMLQSCPWVHFV